MRKSPGMEIKNMTNNKLLIPVYSGSQDKYIDTLEVGIEYVEDKIILNMPQPMPLWNDVTKKYLTSQEAQTTINGMKVFVQLSGDLLTQITIKVH